MLINAKTVAVTVVSLLLVYKIAMIIVKGLTGPLRSIPGPFVNRFTNLTLKKHVLGGTRLHYIHALHNQYGPIVRISSTELAIADLSSTREIHRIGSGFLKSSWYSKFSNEGKKTGIFATVDPKVHAVRRKLFSHAFSMASILSWEDILQDRTTLAVEKIKKEAVDGGADILKWWTFMATDVIAELGFGESFGALENGKKSAYSKDLETAMFFSGMRVELSPLTSILEWIPHPSIQYFLNSAKRLHSYGLAAIEKSKSPTSKSAGRGTIFSKMVTESKDGKGGLTDSEIEREASNLIVAGSDTTAVTLTYLVYAVLTHPSIKERLLTEVSTLSPGFSSKEANTLPYLALIIKETLRLYGAAPGSLPRTVPEGGQTLGSYFVPEGTTVSTQAFTLHRDATIFEDPEAFKPERWEAPDRKMKDAFMPFGGGSRVCIGLHLAQLELALGAAKFFRECGDAKVRTPKEDMEFENYFLIAPKGHKCEIYV